MPYDPMLVQPMREELTRVGVEELMTAQDVDAFLRRPGSKMLIVNSVCGCAAGGARPGVALALRHTVLPQHVGTVFAGQDIEATARARAHLTGVPPSSPSIALFRDQTLVHFVPRHQIEGRDGRAVAADLTHAFDQHLGQAPAAK
jgi:putative YphP/YqiW family bacilliredoxin